MMPLAATALAVLSILVTSVPADATYTGSNGRIAFAANIGRAGRWDIYTMRPGGTGLKRLIIQPTPDWEFPSPDWSPDGRQILFTSPSPSLQRTQIYRVDADGTNLTQLTHSASMDNAGATWSPDGSKILVSRQGGREDAIWVMNADGTGATRLTNGRVDSGQGEFTPDGRSIVYASSASGLFSAIWIMNADGSNKRRLTAPSLRAGSPDVSPDGSQVLFMSGGGDPPSIPTAIYTMKIDGSGVTKLTRPGCCHRDAYPNYSPDGTEIIFMTDRNYRLHDGTDIYEMNTDGSDLHQVTTNLTLGGCPDAPFFDCVQPDWGAR